MLATSLCVCMHAPYKHIHAIKSVKCLEMEMEGEREKEGRCVGENLDSGFLILSFCLSLQVYE